MRKKFLFGYIFAVCFFSFLGLSTKTLAWDYELKDDGSILVVKKSQSDNDIFDLNSIKVKFNEIVREKITNLKLDGPKQLEGVNIRGITKLENKDGPILSKRAEEEDYDVNNMVNYYYRILSQMEIEDAELRVSFINLCNAKKDEELRKIEFLKGPELNERVRAIPAKGIKDILSNRELFNSICELRSAAKEKNKILPNLMTLESETLEKINSEGCFKKSILTKVNCPELQSIPVDCFRYCSYLEEFEAPLLTKIPNYGFYKCSNLKSITSKVISEIGAYGLFDCRNLTELHTKKVEKIRHAAIYYCDSLEKLEFPNLNICEDANFYDCKKLRMLNLGKLKTLNQSSLTSLNNCNIKAPELENIFGLGHTFEHLECCSIEVPKLTSLKNASLVDVGNTIYNSKYTNRGRDTYEYNFDINEGLNYHVKTLANAFILPCFEYDKKEQNVSLKMTPPLIVVGDNMIQGINEEMNKDDVIEHFKKNLGISHVISKNSAAIEANIKNISKTFFIEKSTFDRTIAKNYVNYIFWLYKGEKRISLGNSIKNLFNWSNNLDENNTDYGSTIVYDCSDNSTSESDSNRDFVV